MTTYLSRLILDPGSRDVRRDLADRHALHQRMLAGFPTTQSERARAAFGILFRLEVPPVAAGPTILLQSNVRPDWSRLPADYVASTFDALDNPACKSVDDWYGSITSGDELTFRLLANPTRRIPRGQAGANRLAGKRVALLKEEEQIDWLRRKAADGGYELLTVGAEANDLRWVARSTGEDRLSVLAVQTMPRGETVGYRREDGEGAGRQRLTFGVVLFEGRLRIVDSDRFRTTLVAGVGSGKAYGFGLLSVAPVRG